MVRSVKAATRKKQPQHNSSLRRIVVIFACIAIVLTFATMSARSTFAADDKVLETTFFGNIKDDGEGCGVYKILNLVVDILTMGIGIVGVIGIMISGIQYLTARGNEEQARKAKRRIYEIVIGIVSFVLLYAVSQWLLPGGKLNTGSTCSTVSDADLEKIKADKAAKQQSKSQQKKTTNSKLLVDSSNLKISTQIAKRYTPAKFSAKINQGKIAPPPVCTNCTWSERIAQTAEFISWPLPKNSKAAKTLYKKYHHNGISQNNKSWSDLKGAKPTKAFQNAIDAVWPNHNFTSVTNVGADCGVFVGVAIRYSGFDSKSIFSCPNAAEYYSNSKLWKKVSTAKRGDVCVVSGCHTRIYLGDGLSAEANHHGQNFGHIVKAKCDGYQVFRVKG